MKNHWSSRRSSQSLLLAQENMSPPACEIACWMIFTAAMEWRQMEQPIPVAPVHFRHALPGSLFRHMLLTIITSFAFVAVTVLEGCPRTFRIRMPIHG